MDPLSAIVFFIFGATFVRFWSLISAHEKQIYRLVSDRESEKGTLARVHRDYENRLRSLERRAPHLPDDSQENQQGNG